MKKFYVDKTAEKECAGYFLKDCELIWAGSTVSSVPLSERKRHGEEYERFAREYGIQFFFEDNAAVPEFYTVPWTEVFASDGEGGFLAVLNGDVQSEGAVCLISADRKCFYVAENVSAFVENPDGWREQLRPERRIQVFKNLEEAQKHLEFWKPESSEEKK